MQYRQTSQNNHKSTPLPHLSFNPNYKPVQADPLVGAGLVPAPNNPLVGAGLVPAPNNHKRSPLPRLLLVLLVLCITACDAIFPNETEIVPPLIMEPPPAEAFETVTAFQNADVPARDLADLTRRFRNIDSIPTTAEPETYAPGDIIPFWYKNHATNENIMVNAVLAHQSDNLNLWFEESINFDADQVVEAAAILENDIFPTVRTFFGQELTPGVDRDPRVQILHLESIGGSVAGYFSEADEFVTIVNPFSNQKELLYISLEYAEVGSDSYYGVIAHEFQHMIHWATDANEASWLNEGLSELAAHLNGYTSTGFIQSYADRTDTQLNDFAQQSEATTAHYGAAFLFTTYFLERFGEEATRTLVRSPENGPGSIELTLSEIGSDLTFDDLFADWLAANYLDGLDNTAAIYQHDQLEIPELEPAAEINRFPTTGEAAVRQYGADYLEIESDEPLTLVFTGTTQTNLLNTTAHSGQMFWSSYAADSSNVSLTRRFDLTGLETATLSFWTWYELETGWDYAYLTVSEDEGQSWQLLETPHTTLDNPQGNSYGPAYTGLSGGGEEPVWIQDSADLSPYSGRSILIRFEVVTDEAIHLQGFALDDIAVSELNFLDDAESDAANWETAGFVRHANILPQSFILQLLLFQDNGVDVHRLELEEGQRGRWTIPMGSGTQQAVLIVAGNAPVTRLPAAYAYNFIKELP